jgi:D-glycero-alpha-D-manno-heptose 1-phosphate guanylyltransferase
MEAIVLAGGLGTRLRQTVPDLPKPMAPIAGRPFLEILLGSLQRKGVTRAILSVGFMADKIMAHFGYRFHGLEIDYAVEEKPLGTGGAIRLAMEASRADHAFVFNGDTFLDLEVHSLEQRWQEFQRPILVGRLVPDTARFGRLVTEHGQVVGFTEKGVGGPGLINAGCYVFGREQLSDYPLNQAFSLEIDYLAKKVCQAPMGLFVTEGQFIDIGVPEDFVRAQTELAAW